MKMSGMLKMFRKRAPKPRYMHPALDSDCWEVRRVLSQSGTVQAEYLPISSDPMEVDRVITATTCQSGLSLDLQHFLQENLKSPATTGRHTARVLELGETAAVYEWLLEDDLEAGTRHFLGRAAEEQGVWYMVGAERIGSCWAPDERGRWLTLLRQATLQDQPPVVSERWDASPEERRSRLDRAVELLKSTGDPRSGLSLAEVEKVLASLDVSDDPGVYALLQLLYARMASGHRLIVGCSSIEPDVRRKAISASRAALRIAKQTGPGELVSSSLAVLARTLLLGRPATEGDLRNARAVYLRLLDEAREGSDRGLWLRLLIDLAHLETRLAAQGHESMWESAEEILTLLDEGLAELGPKERIEALLVRAELLRAQGRLQEALPVLDQAQALALDDASWTGTEGGVAELRPMITIYTTHEQRTVQAHLLELSPEELTNEEPSGEREGGKLLLLRPLQSTRRLLLPNEFTDRQRAHLSEPLSKPKTLSLEAVLHCALVRHFLSHSVGGPYDALGMTRIQVIPKGPVVEPLWQEVVSNLARDMALILMVPAESEGMQWEIRHLVNENLIGRLAVVMVPETADPDGAAQAWQRTREACAESGLRLPPYRTGGAFVFFGETGAVRDELPFRRLWDGELTEACLRHVRRNRRLST